MPACIELDPGAKLVYAGVLEIEKTVVGGEDQSRRDLMAQAQALGLPWQQLRTGSQVRRRP